MASTSQNISIHREELQAKLLPKIDRIQLNAVNLEKRSTRFRFKTKWLGRRTINKKTRRIQILRSRILRWKESALELLKQTSKKVRVTWRKKSLINSKRWKIWTINVELALLLTFLRICVKVTHKIKTSNRMIKMTTMMLTNKIQTIVFRLARVPKANL